MCILDRIDRELHSLKCLNLKFAPKLRSNSSPMILAYNCVCCLQDISLQKVNFASCVIMGDNGQANVHCRFVDENDLSHLNIRRFILKLDRKFSGLDKNLEEKVLNYYGHHVWIEFRDLCELNHWIVHPDVLQCYVNSDLLVMRKMVDSPRFNIAEYKQFVKCGLSYRISPDTIKEAKETMPLMCAFHDFVQTYESFVVVAEVKRYVREHDRLFANSKVTYIRKSFEKCLVLRMFGEGFVGEHQRLFARIPS